MGLGASGSCVPPCPSGSEYTDGIDPKKGGVCLVTCPSGWGSSPWECFKPSSYGRGGGYAYRFWDGNWAWNTCTRDNSEGCEWSLGIAYPKCRDGFRPLGCCVCSPNCPANTSDTGAMCHRDIMSYTIRNPVKCNNNQYMSAGLCYTSCPSNFPDYCGALCVASGQCSTVTKSLTADLIASSSAVLGTVACTVVTSGVLAVACIASLASASTSSTNAVNYISTNVPNYC